MLIENSCINKYESREESVDLPSLYPVVLGSSETSITFDTDSTSSEELSDQLTIPNQILSPGSTVHVENSTDVVIGPLTQFHGPVTIYQNINSEKTIEGKILTADEKPKENKSTSNTLENKLPKKNQTLPEVLSKTSTKRLLVYSVIIFVALITVVLGVTLSLKLFIKANESTDKKNTEEVTATDPPLTSHRFYDKQSWGGRPTLNFTKPLVHPVEYVLISHTAGRFCNTFSECSSIMQQIQSMHVSNKSPDIGYNFLIGGDGSVYYGRGWDIVNFHRNNSIAISFIGNYVFDELTLDMVSALKDLLGVGVKLKKLSSNYKIVCHNQTSATLSPGGNVYSKISQLPHFYEGRI